MNINDFARLITIAEEGKIQISIAQVKEVLRLVNLALGGTFYTVIRRTDRQAMDWRFKQICSGKRFKKALAGDSGSSRQ